MTAADLLRLGRWRVSLLAALSTLAGAAAFSAGYVLHLRALVPAAGALLLAMGASALNQVLERALDARMERTSDRPLPAGRVSAPAAAALAVALCAAGTTLLTAGGHATPALLGLLAVGWYAAVYTPAKGRTPYAALPGALVGAIPPLIGWTAAGGSALDPRALLLAVVFLLWQVPHFWVLLLRRGAEYEAAGLPSLTRRFSPPQLARMTFAWIAAAGVSGALVPLAGLASTPLAPVYPVLGLPLLAVNAPLLLRRGRRSLDVAFRSTNLYLLAMILLLAADRLLRLR